MDSFYFKPNINSIINLNHLIQLHQIINHHYIHLNFYAIEQPNQSNYTPQIWTDAPQNTSTFTSSPQWNAIPFHPITPLGDTVTIWHARLTLNIHHQLPINYRFTYRLLPSASTSSIHPSGQEQIVWLGTAGQDGQIISTPESNDSLKDLLLDWCRQRSLDHQLIPHPLNLHSIDYHLYTLGTSPQDGIQADANHPQHFTYQHPIPLADHFLDSLDFEILAFVRTKPFWFTPYPLVRLSGIPSSYDTQLIIIQDPREDYQKNMLILIPISTNSSTSFIRSTSHSPLTICTTTAFPTPPPTVKLLIISGPQSKLKHILNHHSFIPNHVSSHNQLNVEQDQAILRNPKKLGYCTWDSLGENYKISDLLRALESFQKNGMIHLIDRVLLDDGWQDVNGRFLSGWGTKQGWMDLRGFENGESNSTNSSGDLKKNCATDDSPITLPGLDSDLSRAISLIRNVSNQSIKLVGVWVSITGYWCGLDPQSEVMKKFELQTWSIAPIPQMSKFAEPTWVLPKKSCIRPFWDTYFKYLKSAGVQFIKIDNQAGLDRLTHCQSDPKEDVEVYKTTLIDIVNDLARQYFGESEAKEETSAIIHSMAHSPQIWFREHSTTSESSSDLPKPKKKGTNLPILSTNLSDKMLKKVMRTSDDFFPDLLEFSVHQWHILSNSFNSILANGLGFIPDFDMTMTKHQYSDYHAAFRVFSNSQIYITDRIGEHDLSTCHKLTAPLKSNRRNAQAAVIQSMDGAGCVLSGDCLGQSAKNLSLPDFPWGLLKVGLPVSYADGGLIGVWNLKEKSQFTMPADVITARDIAESILSNRPNGHHSKISTPTDNPDPHQNNHGQKLVNLVVFGDDNFQGGQKTMNGRMKVIEDFDLNLEINFPQFASRPIIGTSLGGRDRNAFEIWRVCTLLDLPFESKQEANSLQVACLGLRDQFAGLCAVTTCSPTKKPSNQRAHVVESHLTTQAIKKHTAQSDRPTPISGSLTNGQLPPTTATTATEDQNQNSRKVSIWLINMVGFDCRCNQKKLAEKFNTFCQDFARGPIRTIKFEIRELIKFIILLTWKSLKSIMSYFMESSPPTKTASEADSHGILGHETTTSLTDAPPPVDCRSERTPLLSSDDHRQSKKQFNYVPPTPSSFTQSPALSTSSSVAVDTPTYQEEGLKFYTLFTAPIGFLIRMKLANPISNNSDDDDHNKSQLLARLEKSMEVRIEDHLFPINAMDQKLMRVEVVNSFGPSISSNTFSPSLAAPSSSVPSEPGGSKNQVGEFLLTIDLNHLPSTLKSNSCSSNNEGDENKLLPSDHCEQDFWMISIRAKNS